MFYFDYLRLSRLFLGLIDFVATKNPPCATAAATPITMTRTPIASESSSMADGRAMDRIMDKWV